MLKETNKRRDGFQGQKAIIIPKRVLDQTCSTSKIVSDLYITDIGYYPRARFHYRRRVHGADQHILIYCIEGSGTVTIGENSFNISSGEFFIVPKKTTHVYSADEDTPWTIYWVHFVGDKGDELIKYLREQFNGFKKSIDYAETTISVFDRIYNCLERGYSMSNMIYANLCFGYFLVSLLQPDKPSFKDGIQEADVINSVIDYMKNNLSQMCTLQQMADNSNISASHLSALFKQKTGYPPIEYFNHLKVQSACQYLMFTDLRVNEIGMKLGIDDPYYFSRFFKRRVGMSPHIYRAKRRKTESKE